ncbi:MAG: hypothetical protein IKQ70_10605 [Bacteroidales bacterium]|nr:hypothetical protein [Bacteroidales bacterium]
MKIRKLLTFLSVLMLLASTASAQSNTNLSTLTDNYTAQNGEILSGTTSQTITIADDASITLNGVTITGGIVCKGTATITLVGTNSVSGADKKAGIQIGGSGTTLTINGDGSLTANGAVYAAGIGLNGAFNVTEDVIGGNIVINGGNITANGGVGAAGIGAGFTKDNNNSSERKAIVGNITIKGGTVTAVGVKAVGGNGADGIGAGDNIYNATYQIGTVTIYDDIEMVDASSISESVTYKHDETDVTANASNYFTITEDGNRRIIVPKDDTDYTITIANGIEHGSLTGAATAKYMEKVTITATPALGYRFSRLVVKDAQNNDVESTANSFFMPKSNVTVSAVFEQGTHGTTEFTWENDPGDGPESIVGKTIYNGVTTENLQQGRIYQIKTADYEYLKIDNDENEVSIPYSGGTGTFMMVGTNFALSDDATAGFYDITMTDAGNVKWNVSILKTAGQMDVVPDQTYTGSEIKPEPLVMAGSLNITKGTDYEYSYTNNTNAGTATVRATFKGTYASLGYVEKTFTINPKVTTLGALTLTEYGDRTTAEIQGDFTNISSEGKSLEILKPKTVNKVIFKRSFTKGIPATIMLPFNFTLDASIGSFYTIESVAKNDNGEWIATPKVVTGTLQANTPYMFKAAKDLKELSFADENGITLQSTSTIEINTNGDWTLHGVYEKTMLDGDGEFNYGFAGQAVTADGISVGDFIRAGEGVWADPMRCYLTYKKGELTKAATVLPDRIRVVFPDEENSNNETTDIIENTETEDVVTHVSEISPENGVKVWSFNGTVYIEAQSDMDYTIVDLTGRTIKKGVTHSTHEEINLNAKGIVIVKIGNKSFKLK